MTLSAKDLRSPELLQRLRHRLVETENQLRNHRNLGWRPDALRLMNEDVGQLHSGANSMQPALARMIEPLMQSLHTAIAAPSLPPSVQTMQMLIQAGMRWPPSPKTFQTLTRQNRSICKPEMTRPRPVHRPIRSGS